MYDNECCREYGEGGSRGHLHCPPNGKKEQKKQKKKMKYGGYWLKDVPGTHFREAVMDL